MYANKLYRILSWLIIFCMAAASWPAAPAQALSTSPAAPYESEESFANANPLAGYQKNLPLITDPACYPTDLDCDQDVDQADVSLAVERWNCTASDACFAPRLDQNANGVIDAFDLANIANDFDISPPVITLISPVKGQVKPAGSLQVTGTVADRHAVTRVTVNGVTAALSGSSFQVAVSLDANSQVLDVVAEDALGRLGTASQIVPVDSAGPMIEILSPKHRQAVYTRTPWVDIHFTDNYSPISLSSVSVLLLLESGQQFNVTSSLAVTNAGVTGVLPQLLDEDESYTLAVSVADNLGNLGKASTAFYVPAHAESIIPPAEHGGAGWLSGVIYDSSTCSEHLTGCQGLPGAAVTLAEKDGPGISGTVISGPDGFFAFPVEATGHYWLRAEKEGFTYGQREAAIIREHSTSTNDIYLTRLDPAVTLCDASGCLHTSADGVMRVEIPAGAIPEGEVVTTTATNFKQVEFLPSGELPPGTAETYAFNLGGASEASFTQPVTVSLANSIGFHPGFRIPLGYWNQNTLEWEHAGFGVVDETGQWVVMQVTHFSNYDCNAPWAGPGGVGLSEANADVDDETNDDGSDNNNSPGGNRRNRRSCRNGSEACFVELSTGVLEEDYSLPPVKILSEEVAPTFVYNSSRAAPSVVIDMKLSVKPGAGADLGSHVGFDLFIEGQKTRHFTFSAEFLEGEVGRYRYLWDGRDAQGRLMPPGIYSYQVMLTIPFVAQWCGTDYFGGPPNCVDYPSGIFVEMNEEVWAVGTIELTPQLSSPYGAGWVLDGQQHLYEDQGGQILIVDGERSDHFYFPWKNQLIEPVSQTVNSLVAWANGGSYSDLTPDTIQYVAEDTIKASPGSFIRTTYLPYEFALSPDESLAYLTYFGESSSISIIDLDVGQETGSIFYATEPMDIVISHDGRYAYTTHPSCWIDPSTMAITDLTTQEVVTMTLGSCAYYAALSPDGNTLYVTDRYDNNISVVDLVHREIAATIPIAYRPERIVLSPDGALAYVSTRYGLAVVDLVNRVQVTVVSLPEQGVIAISPDGAYAYSVSRYYRRLEVIDLSSYLVNGIDLGVQYPKSIAVTSNGKLAYIASDAGEKGVTIVDLEKQIVTGSINGGAGEHPQDIAVSAAGNLLYLLDSYIGHLTVLDLALGKEIKSAGAGDYPVKLKFSPDGSRIYTVNSRSGTVSVYDTVEQQDVAVIPVGANPSSIALTSDGSTAYVTNENSYSISVLDLENNTTVDTISLDWSSPKDILLSADQKVAYILEGDRIALIDLAAKTKVGSIALSARGTHFDLTPDKNNAYVSAASYVLYVDLVHQVEVLRIPNVSSAHGIKVSPTGEYIYAVDVSTNCVKRIDSQTGEVIDIPTLHSPEHISLSPDGTYAYVTHWRNAVSVIDLTALKTVDIISTNIYPVDVAVAGQAQLPSNAISRTATDNTTLSYDPLTLTYTRKYPDGSMVHFNPDGSHDYTQDPNGNRTLYAYQPAGTLASMSILLNGDSTPRWTWTFSYAGQPAKITSVSDPAGRTTTFQVNAHGFLTAVTGPDGASRTYAYAQNALLTHFTNENHEVTIYRYDGYGRIKAVEEPPRPVYNADTGEFEIFREVLTFSNKDTSYPLINDSLPGDPDQPAPPAAGSPLLLAQVVSGVTSQSGHTNVWGQWLDITDALGNTTTFQRDSSNNPTRTVYPDGACSVAVYDARGNKVSETRFTQAQCSTGSQTLSPEDVQPAPSWTFTYEERFNHLKTSIDPLGNTTTYTYDYEQGVGDSGKLIRVEYPGVHNEVGQWVVPVESYAYNAWGQVITETNKMGVVTVYGYTQGVVQEAYGQPGALFAPGVSPVPGLLARVVRDYGGLNETTQYKNFNAAGYPMTILGPGTAGSGGSACCSAASTDSGTAAYLTYDARNRILTETNALGIVTKFEYDGRGSQIRKIQDYTADPSIGRNVVSSFVYSAGNLLVQERTAADGLVVQVDYGYNLQRQLAFKQDSLGAQTIYRYDRAKRLISITDPAGYVTRYTYSPAGRLETKTDPDGFVTRMTYDALGRLLSQQVDEGSLKLTTSYTYDLNGNVLSVMDPAGVKTCYQYDSHNRRTLETRDCGGLNLTTIVRYNLNGSRVVDTDPRGVVSLTQYDALDRVTRVVFDQGGLNMEIRYHYSLTGDLERMVDERGVVTTYTYDPLHNLLQECQDALGLNACTHYSYDRLGHRLTTTEPGGAVLRTEYSAFGLLLRSIEDYGGVYAETTYTYDAALNLVLTIDPNGSAVYKSYTSRGELAKETFPDGESISTTYDGRGNPKIVTRQDGSTVTSSYDGAGRLVGRLFSGGGSQTYGYDPGGRLASAGQTMNGHTSLLSFTYNALGEVTATGQSLDGTGWQVGYARDYQTNQVTVSYPSGTKRIYQYDPLGRLLSIKSGTAAKVVDYTYSYVDGYISLAFANGLTQRLDYNNLGQTVRVSSALSDYRYGYDASGSKTSMQRWHEQGRPADVYQYDGLNQVSQVWYGANSTQPSTITAQELRQSYRYDLAGNRLAVQENGVAQAYLPNDGIKLTNPMNRYLQVGTGQFTYDRRGNTLTDGVNSYAYDALNRQIQASNSNGSVEYIYDALDRRIARVSGASTTVFIYDTSFRVLEERIGSGLAATYTYGSGIDEVLTMERGGSSYVFLRDGVGSITEVANASGALVEYYKYGVYGQVRIFNASRSLLSGSAVGNPYLFTGARFDSETGNYYFRARMYSARIGRFLQMDPMRDGLNLYRYARNNPLESIDPLGLFDLPVSLNMSVSGSICFPAAPCPVCYICFSLQFSATGFSCCNSAGERSQGFRLAGTFTIAARVSLIPPQSTISTRVQVNTGFIGDCPSSTGWSGDVGASVAIGFSIVSHGMGCSLTYSFITQGIGLTCGAGYGSYSTGVGAFGSLSYTEIIP